jgi:DnaK suppressor protein
MENLKTSREDADKALNTYAWIDKNKGVVRIPISRAMELTIAQLAQQKPAAAGPIATPASAEATAGKPEAQAASPAPAGSPQPGATQSAASPSPAAQSSAPTSASPAPAKTP